MELFAGYGGFGGVGAVWGGEEGADGPGGGCQHVLDFLGGLEGGADVLAVAAGSKETV